MVITKLEQLKEKLQEQKVTVIDFYADWCGPCKMLSPVFAEVAKEIPDVNFVKVNIDKFNDLATQFGILSIPTLVFVNNGEEVKRRTGFMSKEQLIEAIFDIK